MQHQNHSPKQGALINAMQCSEVLFEYNCCQPVLTDTSWNQTSAVHRLALGALMHSHSSGVQAALQAWMSWHSCCYCLLGFQPAASFSWTSAWHHVCLELHQAPLGKSLHATLASMLQLGHLASCAAHAL